MLNAKENIHAKDVDGDLARKFKAKVKMRGETVKAVIEKFAAEYVKRRD